MECFHLARLMPPLMALFNQGLGIAELLTNYLGADKLASIARLSACPRSPHFLPPPPPSVLSIFFLFQTWAFHYLHSIMCLFILFLATSPAVFLPAGALPLDSFFSSLPPGAVLFPVCPSPIFFLLRSVPPSISGWIRFVILSAWEK